MNYLLQKPYQRLKSARISKGYAKAKDFVTRHDLSYSTYAAHESGRIPLTTKSAQKYGKILDLPFTWLLYGNLETRALPENIHQKQPYEVNQLARLLTSKILMTILKVIDKYDNEVNYQELTKQCDLIMREIMQRKIDQEEVDTHLATIIGLSKKNLLKIILNSER